MRNLYITISLAIIFGVLYVIKGSECAFILFKIVTLIGCIMYFRYKSKKEISRIADDLINKK